MKQYLYDVASSFDVFINVLLGGKRFQSISARLYTRGDIISRWIRKLLDTIDEDHCSKAYKLYKNLENTYYEDLLS
jgi:hypothetical protein